MSFLAAQHVGSISMPAMGKEQDADEYQPLEKGELVVGVRLWKGGRGVRLVRSRIGFSRFGLFSAAVCEKCGRLTKNLFERVCSSSSNRLIASDCDWHKLKFPLLSNTRTTYALH